MQYLDHSNRCLVVLKGMDGLGTVACKKDVLVLDGKLEEWSLIGFHGSSYLLFRRAPIRRIELWARGVSSLCRLEGNSLS